MNILNSRFVRVINGFINGMNRRYISTFATNGAFYLFLSLFPLAILISSILPYTGLDHQTVLDFFDAFVPEPMTALINQIVTDIYGKNVAALSLSALVTVWSAAKAFAAIIKGIEMITGDLDDDFYLIRRLRGSLYTLFMLAAVFLSLLLMVFGKKISNMLETAWPFMNSLITFLLKERYISSFVILTVIFLLLYHAVPRKPERWRHLLPGAVFASLSWLLFSWLFSLYISWSGSYSIYGRLATLVLAMLWMYYVVYLLMIGAWLNEYLAELRRGKLADPPQLPGWALRMLTKKDRETKTGPELAVEAARDAAEAREAEGRSGAYAETETTDADAEELAEQ